MSKYHHYRNSKRTKGNIKPMNKLRVAILKIINNNLDDISRYILSDIFKFIAEKKIISKISKKRKTKVKRTSEYYFFTDYRNYRFSKNKKLTKKDLKPKLVELIRDNFEDILPYILDDILLLLRKRRIIRKAKNVKKKKT